MYRRRGAQAPSPQLLARGLVQCDLERVAHPLRAWCVGAFRCWSGGLIRFSPAVSFYVYTKVMEQELTPSVAFASLAVWNELRSVLPPSHDKQRAHSKCQVRSQHHPRYPRPSHPMPRLPPPNRKVPRLGRSQSRHSRRLSPRRRLDSGSRLPLRDRHLARQYRCQEDSGGGDGDAREPV